MSTEQDKAFQKYLESLRALDGARSQLGASAKLFLEDKITRAEFATYARKEQEAERACNLAEMAYRHPIPDHCTGCGRDAELTQRVDVPNQRDPHNASWLCSKCEQAI